jgi:hypothetical protein
MQAKKLSIKKPSIKKRRMSRIASIRLTIETGAAEFEVNPRTLVSRIKAAGILPGDDGRFSIAQIDKAKNGNLEKERTRKMKEDADQAALQNARERRELMDVADFVRRLEPIVVAMKQRIMGSTMTDAEKDGLCKELASLLRGSDGAAGV